MIELTIREATADDLPAILSLLFEDEIAAPREIGGLPPAPCYVHAFDRIAADPRCRLFVGEISAMVVGSYQMTLFHTLARQGALRADVEGVQVMGAWRNMGLGRRLMAHAEAVAKQRGAALIQLTSSAERSGAHRFYQRMGYARSHAGFKKAL